MSLNLIGLKWKYIFVVVENPRWLKISVSNRSELKVLTNDVDKIDRDIRITCKTKMAARIQNPRRK